MRRELEKLNFPGYWTVDATGEFVGHNGGYTYGFTQKKKAGDRYDVEAKRRSKIGNRETRCTPHCHTDVSNAEAKKKIAGFVKAVVEGL